MSSLNEELLDAWRKAQALGERRMAAAQEVLAQAKAAAGDLAKLRAVRIGGYVNSTPDFANVPQVVNGASDLFAAVLGDNGKHARFAVGVAQLPLDAAVEVEGTIIIAGEIATSLILGCSVLSQPMPQPVNPHEGKLSTG